MYTEKKLIGCEVGNFDTKLVAEDMIDIAKGEYLDEPIAILNMISIGKNRRSYANNLSGKKDQSLINLLDVTIETEADPLACGRWFVGGLAFKEGSKILKPTKKNKKSENPQTIILMLTALAYYLYDPKNPVKTESVRLSTLLPTEEYFPKENDPKDYIKILDEKLHGKKHTVEFHDKAFNGAKITIDINDLIISPEGAVAQIASIYNWDASVKEEFKGLENKKLMNIDFGSIDTNVSILEDGEFMQKGIFGFKGGTTEVLKEIAADVEDEKGHLFDTFKLDYHIRSKRPLLLGDEDITEYFTKTTTSRYNTAGWGMANSIIDEMEDRGISINEISIINFTGGGSQFFKPSVEPQVKGVKTKVVEPKRPRYANAEGALKQLIFERISENSASKEVFED